MRQRYFFPLCFICLVASQAIVVAQPGGRGFGGPDFFGGPEDPIEPADLPFELGVATIPDRDTFEKLSYQGPMRGDAYLSDLEFVKFIIEDAQTDDAKVYWMNTENMQAHPQFMGAVGLRGGFGRRGGRGGGRLSDLDGGDAPRGMTMRGAVTYLPRLIAPDGSAGLYIYDFQPNDHFSFEEIKSAHQALVKTMPYVTNKLAFHPFEAADYEVEKQKYDDAKLPVHLDSDIYGEMGYLPLNVAKSFGRLRLMDNDTRPAPRDIVICKTLPNQLPRVAGVISEARQTPLSHVNLRAIQDKVPNAFIIDASQSEQIRPLLGKLVAYEVSTQGFKLREATQAEVEAHFQELRPKSPQTPERDLAKREILALEALSFQDASAYGVKAANLAAMHTFDMPAGTVPDGIAVPFYFYDEFMKVNGFYDLIEHLLHKDEFRKSRSVQEQELARFRSLMKKGKMPNWMMAALHQAQKSFPAGTSIRCRSSTNNEDLPGFSGAGLYDSYTHRPREGHLSKSVKQVFASLWNFRAFEEREFYRIDHRQTAMGVLMHANFKDEKVNGVAVTDDILYETYGNYYLNTQLGEDLVTNPSEQSSPEEILLGWYEEDGHQVVRKATAAGTLLNYTQLEELRDRLARIHGRFQKLYEMPDDEPFAMEIEFKITKLGKLVIKQARPWVF